MLFFILPVKHDSTVLKKAGRMTDMKNYLKQFEVFSLKFGKTAFLATQLPEGNGLLKQQSASENFENFFRKATRNWDFYIFPIHSCWKGNKSTNYSVILGSSSPEKDMKGARFRILPWLSDGGKKFLWKHRKMSVFSISNTQLTEGRGSLKQICKGITKFLLLRISNTQLTEGNGYRPKAIALEYNIYNFFLRNSEFEELGTHS